MNTELMLSFLAVVSQEITGVELSHVLTPRFSRTQYETACGSTSIKVTFENDLDRNRKAKVVSVSIDGKEVPGAARRLTDVAVDRIIERIGIMNCGYDKRSPVITGSMSAYGRPRLAPTLFFTIKRQGDAWVFGDNGVRTLKSP